MRKVLAKNPQVEQQRLHRRVFLDNIDPENQSLMILVSCFVKTSHFEEYLCVKESILLDLLRVIRHHRARLATPIRTVQRTYGNAGAENATFSETVIARRPLLMLEAPSRINGGSQTKTHMAPSLNEERLVKTAATEPMVTQIYAVTGSVPSDKQHEGKKSSGEDVIKSNKGGTSTSTQSSSLSEENTERPGLKGSASRVGYGQPDSLQVADIEQSDGIPPKLNIMHESENSTDLTSVTKPAMEVNIVLGMALEGSKRTLPLEQEMLPETIDDAEAKEEAASHTASGPTPLIKDRRGYTAETHGDKER